MSTLKPEEIAAKLAQYEKDPAALMALMMYREARSEGQPGRIATGMVALNRCKLAPREGWKFTPSANILHPGAYSSFNSNDPQCCLFPALGDREYAECYVAARQVLGSMLPDNTSGAVFYHDNTMSGPPHYKDGRPVWGHTEKTVQIGRLTFYRIVDSK